MLYVDTSVLVAALLREPATARVQAWLAAQDPRELAISEWTLTELSSAMALKLRTREIDAAQRAAAMALFNRLVTASFEVLAVSREHFRKASVFVDQHKLGLRAGDALHLAIASGFGATVHTLDRTMAKAGLALGVSVTSP